MFIYIVTYNKHVTDKDYFFNEPDAFGTYNFLLYLQILNIKNCQIVVIQIATKIMDRSVLYYRPIL